MRAKNVALKCTAWSWQNSIAVVI